MTPQESGKVWPCEHIHWDTALKTWGSPGVKEWKKFVDSFRLPDYWYWCPICGAKRPEEEKDELDAILYESLNSQQQILFVDEFKKKLRVWKENENKKEAQIAINKAYSNFFGKEEKPKRLWEVLMHSDRAGMPEQWEDIYRAQSKAALDWFEGILPAFPPKGQPFEYQKGWNNYFQEIRQRLEKERGR